MCVGGGGNKKLTMREKRDCGGLGAKKNKKLTMREKREMGKEEETNDEREI